MNVKFSDLPIQQKIPLTKKSIQRELEINEGVYPKNTYIITNYMLEIIEYIEQLEIDRDYWKQKNLLSQKQ